MGKNYEVNVKIPVLIFFNPAYMLPRLFSIFTILHM